MQVKDRPKAKVDIGRIDLTSTPSYERSDVPRYLLTEPVVPKLMAQIVSEKGEITIGQLAEAAATATNEPSEKIRKMVEEYLKTDSCNGYLNPGRRIVERNGHVFLAYTGIKKENCVTIYGCVCYGDGEIVNRSREDFRRDNKPHISYRE